MILKKLKLKNFRGYKDFEVSFNDSINVIIGRNDIGKSTILDALAIFFQSDKIKVDIADLCVYHDEDDLVIGITCCFDVGKGEILIDSTSYTNCADEYLLNEEGLLEIRKTWDCSSGSIGKSSQKDYIIAYYPAAYDPPLVIEKIAALKQRYKALSPNPEYPKVDATVAHELRQAIYKMELSENPRFETTQIEIKKIDSKNIQDTLYKQFPTYLIFESYRSNTDKDSEIQDPMKAITKTVLATMEAQIEAIRREVTERVQAIGYQTIEKLKDMDKDIAQDLTPTVTMKPPESLFSFELKSDNGIPLNKRGSGVRRLILLSYFRAEAEKSVTDDSDVQLIYAIEEPETGQHPNFQQMIFESLNTLSQKPTHQLIVTSHTPEIAKFVTPEQLILLRRNEENQVVAISDTSEKIKGVVEELGILPYAAPKTVIFVEGENDLNFLMNLNQGIPELKSIVDLKAEDIPIIPLHGGNLTTWFNRDYFRKSSLTQIYITDSDVPKYVKLIDEITQVNDGRRFGWYTQRLEMENYIPMDMVESTFKLNLTKYAEEWYHTQDVPQSLTNLWQGGPNDPVQKENAAKMILNGSITKKMTKADLERIDAWEEIESWFRKIRSITDGTYRQKQGTVTMDK